MNSKPYLIIVALIFSASTINCTYASEGARPCDLSKLPIGRESSCEGYFREDNRLNGLYKKLVSSITSSDSFLLKEAQRKWIKFRNEKCQYDEQRAFEACSPLNPSCENLALDMCVIQLTSDRANELENFIANPDGAKIRGFDFLRPSRFGDENYEKHKRNTTKAN